MTARPLVIGAGATIAVIVAVLMGDQGGDLQFDHAQTLLTEGRGQDAALLFEDPVWRGVAEYRAGRFQRAATAFSEAEDATALYNLGNAQAQFGDWAEARRAYQGALRLQPDHEDAQHNLAIVEAAEKLAEDLARAERQRRQADAPGHAADAEAQKGETATEESDGGSRRSVGDAEARAEDSQQSGEARQPGRAAKRSAAESAVGATATLSDGDAGARSQTDGTGAATVLFKSTDEAEILLRRIKDDPARVLKARLRAAHAARQERAAE